METMKTKLFMKFDSMTTKDLEIINFALDVAQSTGDYGDAEAKLQKEIRIEIAARKEADGISSDKTGTW